MTTTAVQPSAKPWTTGAYLSLLAYIVWLPLMFAFGYLLADILGYDPGMTGPSGFLAVAVTVLVAVAVVPLPSWVGAGLAVKARTLGAGAAALVALVLCLISGAVLLVMSLPLG